MTPLAGELALSRRGELLRCCRPGIVRAVRRRARMSRRLRRLNLLLLAGLTLSGAGCLAVAAGAAGAGAATFIYFKGRVCQDYRASFADAWKAIADALKEQGLPLLHQENDGSSGTITSRAA